MALGAFNNSCNSILLVFADVKQIFRKTQYFDVCNMITQEIMSLSIDEQCDFVNPSFPTPASLLALVAGHLRWANLSSSKYLLSFKLD